MYIVVLQVQKFIYKIQFLKRKRIRTNVLLYRKVENFIEFGTMNFKIMF